MKSNGFYFWLKKYSLLSNPNVTEVISVSDSDETIGLRLTFCTRYVFTEVETTASNDHLLGFSDDTPYLLNLEKLNIIYYIYRR